MLRRRSRAARRSRSKISGSAGPAPHANCGRLGEEQRTIATPRSPQRLPLPQGLHPLRPEQAVELKALYEELPYAAMRAAAALRTDGTVLRGDDLLPFWHAESAVTKIIQRINELLAPGPWPANLRNEKRLSK